MRLLSIDKPSRHISKALVEAIYLVEAHLGILGHLELQNGTQNFGMKCLAESGHLAKEPRCQEVYISSNYYALRVPY